MPCTAQKQPGSAQRTRPPVSSQYSNTPCVFLFRPPSFLKGWQAGTAAAADDDDGAGGGGEAADPHPCPLEAMFLALEQVLPLFRRRRQATLLKQVRPAVEGMCGRSFTRHHLAQIVSVQPGMYACMHMHVCRYVDILLCWQTALFCSFCLLLVARPIVGSNTNVRARRERTLSLSHARTWYIRSVRFSRK